MNTAFFDLETQHSFDQVGGRSHIRDLKLSAAVVYSTADNAYHHYLEADVDRLIADLHSAELVVGFNVVRFDYEVLRAYTLDPLNDLPTVDMLDQIYRKLGFRVSLDNLAGATLGTSKSADGLQAVRWYQEGRIQEILDYCQKDVEVTRLLYEFGRKNRHLKYRDRNYRIQMVPVTW